MKANNVIPAEAEMAPCGHFLHTELIFTFSMGSRLRGHDGFRAAE
jgi:hypothetical protein